MLDDDRMHGEHERGGKVLRINVGAASSAQTVAAGQLRAFIERVERLEEEKKGIADDIKDVYAEMKGQGFDTKAIRTIIRLRKQDQAERDEAEAILDLYMSALGMA